MQITENGELVFGILDEEGMQKITSVDNITQEGYFIWPTFIPSVGMDAIPLGFFNGGIIG